MIYFINTPGSPSDYSIVPFGRAWWIDRSANSGAVIPAVIQIRIIEIFGWLWPSYVNIPTCLLAVLVSLHEKAYKIFDTTVPNVLDIRAGETKECLLAMFLFMYIASFYKRLKEVS